MLAAQPVTRHVHFGDFHHSPGQAQTYSSAQALGYFGDSLPRDICSLGVTMPQYFNMIQELPVEQGGYGDLHMYDDGNGSQDETAGVPSGSEPASSSQTASARRMMSSMGTDRIVAANEAAELAAMQAKQCNWYPTEHVRYQSTMDFKEDMLRNRHISVNEQTFADWAWPPSERNGQKMYEQDSVRWGTDAKFEPLGSLASKFSESRIGVRQKTKFRLETMPEDEDSGNASPSPSASSVSLAESSSRPSRNQTRRAARDTSSKAGAGSMSGINDTKRQREKLTIEQKRRNHIRHEKKRRALIKDGFNDLTELIPELRGRTLSRSTILFKAADWLENLIQENEALVAQVSALESEKATTFAGTAEAPAQNSHKRATRRKA